MEEVIADKAVEWQQILEQAFSMLHRAKETEGDQALQQVSLLGCVGLKTGMVQEAEACFRELLAVDSSKGSAFCYLVCVKNMLMMAARMRKGELFTEWLKEAEERLSITLNQVEQDKAVDFIIALTFIVCDRRYVDSLVVVVIPSILKNSHEASDIIKINDKIQWECPNCGNTDKTKMNVTRRTCGYLGENFWNVGKTKEIKSRVTHL